MEIYKTKTKQKTLFKHAVTPTDDILGFLIFHFFFHKKILFFLNIESELRHLFFFCFLSCIVSFNFFV